MSTTLASAPVIAKDLSWTYTGSPHPLLQNLSFRLEPGERVLIYGDSGSGKSTLALVLAGLLEQPDDGVLQGDLDLGGQPVSCVMQQPEDQTVLSRVEDDVAFGLENTAVKPERMKQIIQDSLHSVGLSVPLHRPTRQLSGGQRQRLNLVAAIAMKPGLVILDEPTSALDPTGQAQVVEAVSALALETGMTMVVIDHNPEPWLGLVNRFFHLDSGTLQETQAPTRALPATAVAAPSRDVGSSPLVLGARALVASRDGRTETTGPHSLSIREGDIVALMGQNGSGKTTLAMTLAGLVAPLSGEITHPVGFSSWSSVQLSAYIGVVPQNPVHMFQATTVRAELKRGQHADSAVDSAVARWNLSSLLDSHPMRLSGGEQRRLALTLATLHNPRLLILDEPSQGLDGTAWRELVATVLELAKRGIGILMATHDERLVNAVSARVHHLTPNVRAAETLEPAPTRGPLERANPLALVLAGLLPAIALLSTVDLVSAATSLVLVALIAPWIGISPASLGFRLLPVALAAVFAGVTISLYGEAAGGTYFSWGLIQITEGSLELAAATTLRILAIGGPAVLLLSRVDPTRLADALIQQARMPANFVVGGLAALRLFDVVSADIELRRWMEKARGVGDKTILRRALHTTTAVLVLAIKRSETLARAMQSRGFGRDSQRTNYRPIRWAASDTLWLLGGLTIGMISVGMALLTGQFNAILG